MNVNLMNIHPIGTEEDIALLVHRFYSVIRDDETLGSIFNQHIHDWDEHLETMVDFWSTILLKTGRFEGAPMPKHVALPDLNAGLFQHWLKLFRQITIEHPNHALGEQAYVFAQRIAQSLWQGYQISRSLPPQALSMQSN